MPYSLQTLAARSIETIPVDSTLPFRTGTATCLICLTENEAFLFNTVGTYMIINWKLRQACPFFGQFGYGQHLFDTGMISIRRANYANEAFLQHLSFLYQRYTGTLLDQARPGERIPFVMYQNPSPVFNGYGLIQYYDKGPLWIPSATEIPEMTIHIPTCEEFEGSPSQFALPDPLIGKVTFEPFVYHSLPPGFSHFSDTVYPWLPYGETGFFYASSPQLHYNVQAYDLSAATYLSLGVTYVTQGRASRNALFCVSTATPHAYLLDLSPVQEQLSFWIMSALAGVLWIGRTRTYLYLAHFEELKNPETTQVYCKYFHRIEFPALATLE